MRSPLSYMDVWPAPEARIAARIIVVVPPAVLRLLPGQRITAAHVAFLQTDLAAGAFILDPGEHGDGRVRVVRA